MNTNKILSSFPKKQNILSDEYHKIYTEHYVNNREGQTSASSVSKKMESWLHKKVAADLQGQTNLSCLEIGAGTLNQLDFENTAPYDIIEPFTELYKNSPHLSKINKIYTDISEVPEGKKYDRITSIATFEHVLDLPKLVARTCLLLNENGSLRVSIPNEGTIMWILGWSLTTGLEFKLKYGLNYEPLLRYEHVNSANEIEAVLRHFYSSIKPSYFGVNKHLAFYRFYECKDPIISNAKAYL